MQKKIFHNYRKWVPVLFLMISILQILNSINTNNIAQEIENEPKNNPRFNEMQPNSQFNPIIDGQMTENEHWDLAENMHTAYLQTDSDHLDNYNYIYSARKNGSLYILVDLCSDITYEEESGEWISIWLDTDNSKTDWNYILNDSIRNEETLVDELAMNMDFLYGNYSAQLALQNGTEAIFYNKTSEAHNVTFPLGEEEKRMISTANFSVANDFNTSLNSPIPHRIYEFEINMTDLNNLTESSDYGILVQGYGTATSYNADYYALGLGAEHSYSAYIINYLYYQKSFDYPYETKIFNDITKFYSILLGACQELYYFPCGTSNDILDLTDNPTLLTNPYSSIACNPSIDGQFTLEDGWDAAENIHTQYLHVNDGESDAYNYIYSSRTNDSLYVLIDLCSNTDFNKSEDEWISIWLDIANTRFLDQYYPRDQGPDPAGVITEFQMNLEDQQMDLLDRLGGEPTGMEGIFYNITENSTYISMPLIDGVNILNSTVNFTGQFGFGFSPNSKTEHRMYEFQINLAELGLGYDDDYGLLVIGNGISTTFSNSQYNNKTGFFTLGQGTDGMYLAQLLNWIYFQSYEQNIAGDTFPNANSTARSILYIASLGYFYYQMGPFGVDLKRNPSFWVKPLNHYWNQTQYIGDHQDYDPTPLIWSDSTNIFTARINDTHYFELKCWDSNGTLIWSNGSETFFNGNVLDIWGDTDYIYISTVQYFTDYINYLWDYSEVQIQKWDKNGNFISSGNFKGTAGYEEGYVITGNDTILFTFGGVFSNITYGPGIPQLICWDKTTLTPLWNQTFTNFEGKGEGILLENNVLYLYGFCSKSSDQYFMAKYDILTYELEWISSWAQSEYEIRATSIFKINNTLYLFNPNFDSTGINFLSFNSQTGDILSHSFLPIWTDVYLDRAIYFNNSFYVSTRIWIPDMDNQFNYWAKQTFQHAIFQVNLQGQILDRWEYNPVEYYVNWFGDGITVCGDHLYTITTRAVFDGEVYDYEFFLVKWNPQPQPNLIPILTTISQTIQTMTLNISWESIIGAVYYGIYINNILNSTTTNNSLILQFPEEGVYSISVSAVYTSGQSEKGTPITINVVFRPEAPIFIIQNQTITSNQITISWNPVQGAVSYNLYVNGILNQTVTNTSTLLSFPGNGTYIITVSAVNEEGIESNQSNILEITVAIPPSKKTELTQAVIIGITIVGTSVGLVGASVLSPDKIKDFIQTRKYVTQNDAKPTSDYLTKSDTPGQTIEISATTGVAEMSPSSPTVPPSNADFLEMVKKLKLLWDKIPYEYREILNRTIDKYYKFKDQAAILVFGAFKGLSNNFFNACDLIRKGEFQDALLKLDDVSKQAAEKKFVDLAEEAQNLATERCKGGEC